MEAVILFGVFIIMPMLLFKRWFPRVYGSAASFLRQIAQALWGARGKGERGGQARLNPRARQRRYRNE
jgi:hypothetical protein